MFTPAQVNTIARRAHHAIEGKGEGHTVYAMGSEYNPQRYVVGGLVPSAMLPIGTPVSAIRAAIVRMLARDKGGVAETLGYWEDGGTLYLDLGTTWTLEHNALKVASQRGELAIYDRETGECIRVSDTPGMHVA